MAAVTRAPASMGSTLRAAVPGSRFAFCSALRLAFRAAASFLPLPPRPGRHPRSGLFFADFMFSFLGDSHSEGVTCPVTVVLMPLSPAARVLSLSLCLRGVPWVLVCITCKWGPTAQVPILIQAGSPVPLCPAGDSRGQRGPLPAGESRGMHAVRLVFF